MIVRDINVLDTTADTDTIFRHCVSLDSETDREHSDEWFDVSVL